MKIGTKYFGNIEIGEEKIIHFENGVLGFEDYKDYTILYDNEKEKSFFSWLQSTEESSLAFPIVNPFNVVESYNPQIMMTCWNQLVGFQMKIQWFFLWLQYLKM